MLLRAERVAFSCNLLAGVRTTCAELALPPVAELAAANRTGLSVPSDLAVIGMDDEAVSAYTQPALTTTRQWKGSLRGVPLPLVPGLENNFPLAFNQGGAKSEPDDRNHQIDEEFSDLYKSIYSHVQDRFKSLPSLLRRTNL
jgi:hypothetical protein